MTFTARVALYHPLKEWNAMPLTLHVGLAQKVGQPNYGSLAASCHLEVELDARLLDREPALLQQEIAVAFDRCRQAVDDELERATGCHADPVCRGRPTDNIRCESRPTSRCACAITPRQMRAIESIALRQRLNLLELLEEECQKEDLAGLTRGEASRLIEKLQRDEPPHGGVDLTPAQPTEP
jgi:hypothetical protein